MFKPLGLLFKSMVDQHGPARAIFVTVLAVESIFLPLLLLVNPSTPTASTVLPTNNTAKASVVEATPGEILVKFSDGVDIKGAKVKSLLESVNGSITDKNKEMQKLEILTIKIPDNANVKQVVQAFSHRGDGTVEFAEPNGIFLLQVTPNDPYYGNEWHLAKTQASKAWDTTQCSSNVTIAIIDTGVDTTHPDLASKAVPGWNFYDNNADTSDVYGHGTAVAGTAVAATNNSTGVAAFGWDCKLMPIRISATNGSGSSSAMANALVWAADHGARVANISYQVTTSSSVSTAAKYFQSKGGVVTIAAGNYSTLHTNPDNLNVLTVVATTSTDALASFSDYGSDIDVAAPGSGIYTTNRGGVYGSWSGTSFSAPVTAGIAALVIAANPALTGAQAQDIVKTSADDLGATGWDATYGWGRVNAASAVAMATASVLPPDTTAPAVSITSPSGDATVFGTSTVTVNATDAVGVATTTLKVDGVVIGTDLTAPYSFSWNTALYANGSHTLIATATDVAGNVGTSTGVTVNVNNVLDTTAPDVTITAPLEGATVSGSVPITFTVSDNIKVGAGTLKIDGAIQQSWNTGATSYSYSWSTKGKKWINGAHTIEIQFSDPSANSSTKSVTVTVNNTSGRPK